MANLMEWVNRVRTLQDLPAIGAIHVADNPDDADECVVAGAIGCRVEGLNDVAFGRQGRSWEWTMRFDERLLARRVGIVMGLPWLPDPPAVELPVASVDLACAESFGRLETDWLNLLTGWWVPADPAESAWEYLTPEDDLLVDGAWLLPRVPRP
jgi:hypothetical protein